MASVSASNIDLIKNAYGGRLNGGDFLPAVYVLEPTSRCNVNCIMCPQSKLPQQSLGEMSLDTLERVASNISSVAELTMLYFMGEPLLHTQFDEYLKIARSLLRGVLVISTNGLLLDDDKVDSIIENKIDLVICCIDRWSDVAYEGIRRGAEFETVVVNTERLLRAKGTRHTPRVIVKALDMQMPQREQIEFTKFWEERGGIPLVGWVNTWAGQFPGLATLSRTPAPYTNVERVPCADLWFKMVINWRGEAVLCCYNYDYSYPLGYVTSIESLYEIWQGEKMRAFRAAHLNREFSCTTLCARCREWGDIKELDVYLQMNAEDFSLVF